MKNWVLLVGLFFVVGCTTLNKVPGTEISESEGLFVYNVTDRFVRVSPSQADWEGTQLEKAPFAKRAEVLTRIATGLVEQKCESEHKVVSKESHIAVLSPAGLIYEKPSMVEFYYICI